MSCTEPGVVAPLVLTVDVGTSSTKAMLYDGHGRVVSGCAAQRANQLDTTPDGGAVFEVDDLCAGVFDAIDDVLHRAGNLAEQIGAVAFDTLVGNVLGVDGNGAPVTPLYIYADTRNAADAQTLRAELGREGLAAAHDRTGCLVHTSYLPARFRWLQRTQPALLAKAKRWVSIGEYLYFKLFGEWAVSYSVAAWSGLLNRRDLAWDGEWLKRLPVEADALSPLVDFGDAMSSLGGNWAARWPALKNLPWYLPIGDGAAANIGSGCDSPSRVALTVGSTGAMRVVVDPSIANVPDGLWLYRVDRQRGLLGGATTEGGNVYGWLRETLQLPDADTLEQDLASRLPGGHGLSVLPFLAGERAPGWREDARGVIAGISLHTTPVDILQASLEAIAYRFGLIYGRIRPNLAGVDHEIVASGGALLGSHAWLQICADVLGRPLHTLGESEATSRGLALLALEQLGVIRRPSDLSPSTGDIFIPDPARHDIYADAIERQVTLYHKVL